MFLEETLYPQIWFILWGEVSGVESGLTFTPPTSRLKKPIEDVVFKVDVGKFFRCMFSICAGKVLLIDDFLGSFLDLEDFWPTKTPQKNGDIWMKKIPLIYSMSKNLGIFWTVLGVFCVDERKDIYVLTALGFWQENAELNASLWWNLVGWKKKYYFRAAKNFLFKRLPASFTWCFSIAIPYKMVSKRVSYSKVPPSGSMFKLWEGGVSKMAGNFEMFDGIPSAEVACTLTKFSPPRINKGLVQKIFQ